MMVLPSDHLIKYNTMFVNTLSEGCAVAEKGANLVTMEITRTIGDRLRLHQVQF